MENNHSEPEYNYPLIKKHNPGEKQSNSLTIHTDTEVWEDAEDTIIELFECIDYSPFWNSYSLQNKLYSQSEIDSDTNIIKTGRKFIIDDKTKQILKVIN